MIKSLIGSFSGHLQFYGRQDMAAVMISCGHDTAWTDLKEGQDYEEITPLPAPGWKKTFVYIKGYVDMSDKSRDGLVDLQNRGKVHGFYPCIRYNIGYDGFWISPEVPYWYNPGFPAVAGSFVLK